MISVSASDEILYTLLWNLRDRVPKGFDIDELAGAYREFQMETGYAIYGSAERRPIHDLLAEVADEDDQVRQRLLVDLKGLIQRCLAVHAAGGRVKFSQRAGPPRALSVPFNFSRLVEVVTQHVT